ncbi:hypothetical protein E3Q02_04118 [Wallemia mellicola]|uniref:Uncharacterized protein n=1 Tax=Wallemia mellicola TaxID=1708541 RepID=A0AB38MRC5_9BASI|nr:hypothetical protein E3Q12_04140 [Wallemia mellicola]TIC60868.1 hypothetical protein E3Q02_04118 [Wallemia mellicola]
MSNSNSNRIQPLCRTKSHRNSFTLHDVAVALKIEVPIKNSPIFRPESLDIMDSTQLKNELINIEKQNLHYQSELSLSTAISYELYQQNEKLNKDYADLNTEIEAFKSLIQSHLKIETSDLNMQRRELSFALKQEVENANSMAWIEAQASELKLELNAVKQQSSREILQTRKQLRDVILERDNLKRDLKFSKERFDALQSQSSQLMLARKSWSVFRQEWRRNDELNTFNTSNIQFPQVKNDSPLAERRKSLSGSEVVSSSGLTPKVLKSTNIPLSEIKYKPSSNIGFPNASSNSTLFNKRIKHKKSFSDSAFIMNSDQRRILTLENELEIAKFANMRTQAVFTSIENFTTYIFNIPSSLTLSQVFLAIYLSVTSIFLNTAIRGLAKVLLYAYFSLVLTLLIIKSQLTITSSNKSSLKAILSRNST